MQNQPATLLGNHSYNRALELEVQLEVYVQDVSHPNLECLHSALKIIAVRILNALVPRNATMEKQKRRANTAA